MYVSKLALAAFVLQTHTEMSEGASPLKLHSGARSTAASPAHPTHSHTPLAPCSAANAMMMALSPTMQQPIPMGYVLLAGRKGVQYAAPVSAAGNVGVPMIPGYVGTMSSGMVEVSGGSNKQQPLNGMQSPKKVRQYVDMYCVV